MRYTIDLTGQRFGRLVAIEPTAQRRRGCVVWRCRCDCGREFYAASNALHHGDIRSCGCTQLANLRTAPPQVKLGMVDGTNLSRIRSSTPQCNNTTGVRGVSETKEGKFEAYIYFKRKKHRIGFYGSLSEAAEARKQAEERVFKPVLEKHAKNKETPAT